MAKRRGHGAGSIYKRADGYWTSTVELGYVDGKRRRKVVYGKTQREVTDALKAIHSKIEQGSTPLSNERRRLGDFLDEWLQEEVKPHRAQSTFVSYEQKVRLHIKPSLGNVPLSKLQAPQIQKLLNAKRDEGLSDRSRQYIHAIIRCALASAERWGYVSRNVAKLTRPVTVRRQEVEPFTPDEVRQLLAVAQDDRLCAFYTVALAIGLRPSEALGLTWEDVDFDGPQPIVRVKMGLQRIDGELKRVRLKTERSRRNIPLPDICAKALREHRTRQLTERLAARDWQDTGFVFVTRRGTPLDGRNVARYFDQLQERAGVERRRLYDARHTAASLLLLQGVAPRVVMEVLGHSTYQLTINTYSHVMPSLLGDAATAMDALLSTGAAQR